MKPSIGVGHNINFAGSYTETTNNKGHYFKWVT